MSLDDRDYMRYRDKESSAEAARYHASEELKRRQASDLKARFARYSRGEPPAPKKAPVKWRRLLIVVAAVALGVAAGQRLPQLALTMFQPEPFPVTGAVRWVQPVAADRHDAAPLTITGFTEVGKNRVIKLEDWETKVPVALIPVRGGETATLAVPLGRYRVSFAPSALWAGEFKLKGATQEALSLLDFSRTENGFQGHIMDLNGRVNGNMPTRQTSF